MLLQDFFSSSSQLIAFRVIFFCFFEVAAYVLSWQYVYPITYLRRDGVRLGPHGRVFVGLGVGYWTGAKPPGGCRRPTYFDNECIFYDWINLIGPCMETITKCQLSNTQTYRFISIKRPGVYFKLSPVDLACIWSRRVIDARRLFDDVFFFYTILSSWFIITQPLKTRQSLSRRGVCSLLFNLTCVARARRGRGIGEIRRVWAQRQQAGGGGRR